MSKLPLSVSIISFNEESNIKRTLESILDIAQEIIIVDSFSSDKTVEIATSMGAKVFSEEWKGHIAQKNSALSKCTQDWVLCLDCDEVLSSELKDSIIDTITNGSKNIGYKINRKTFYLGKLLNYAWQPDLKFRLFFKDLNPRWGGYDPHDVLQSKASLKIISGDLIHYSYKDINDHFQRTIKYAKLTAHSYYKNGKKFSMFKLIFSPIFSFIKDYIVRRGFLDGRVGFIVGMSAPIYVFLKYAFLWEYEKNENS